MVPKEFTRGQPTGVVFEKVKAVRDERAGAIWFRPNLSSTFLR
jgi:hypothetical protein